MRYVWIWTLCCVATASVALAAPGNMIGSQSHNEGMLVLPAPGPVEVDGQLGDWDLSGRIWVFSESAIRDQYSVKISAMWDKEYLYLAARWRDPTPMTSSVDPAFTPSYGWRSDSWQLRVFTDHRADLTTWYFTKAKTAVMHINRDSLRSEGEVLQAKGDTSLGRGIEMAYLKTGEGGYTQELKIPWSELYRDKPNIEPGLEFKLGLEVLWGDVTAGKAMPEHRYSDNMQPGVTNREFYWKNPRPWGNATLVAEGNVEKRRYFPQGSRPQGTIPVRVRVPEAARKFTIAINDETGQRVRNLIADVDPADFEVETSNGQRVVEVLWDGLDDTGSLVPAGTYTIHGLSHKGIDAIYEQAFYNPGSPPWATADSSGAWGSDHADPQRIARAGDRMILSYGIAEGGSALIAIGPDGQKQWGEKRGANLLAADANHVFAFGRDHLNHSWILNRYNARDGSFAPFVIDGEPRPFDLRLNDLMDKGEKTSGVTAVARYQDALFVALADGQLMVLDSETAVLRRTINIGPCFALAGDDQSLFGATDNSVFHINLDNGATVELPIKGVQEIADLAVDVTGHVLVADRGADSQVKAFNANGQLQYTCGVKGGRALRGQFDPQAMMRVKSIDVDRNGDVWATESWANPRRLSVWNPETGKLVRDFVGGTGYSGRNAYLSSDPTAGYVGSIKLNLDPERTTEQVEEILWVPDPKRREGFSLWSDSHWYASPRFFTASRGPAEGQTFLYFQGDYGIYHAFYMQRDGRWQPTSALTTVEYLREEVLLPGLTEHNEKQGVFWNDLNHNAAIEQDECLILDRELPLRGYWGTAPGTDFSLYLHGKTRGTTRYQPVRFASDGAPVYGPEGMSTLTPQLEMEVVPVIEEDLLISLGGHALKGGWLRANNRSDAISVWRYPNPYPGVHGSHRAPMPQPGLVIGPLNIIGVAKVSPTVGNVLMMRGNLGSDYLFTVKDGLFIASLFGDTRLPTPALPDHEADLIGKSVKHYSNGGEPFNGWFGRQSDGQVRMLNGMAGQAAMVFDMVGLDTIQRIEPTALKVDTALLAKAESSNQARSAKSAKPRVYALQRFATPPSTDETNNAWVDIPKLEVKTAGNPHTAQAQLGYTDTHLYVRFDVRDRSPWVNSGKEWDRLFKTGDAVDLQLRVKPSPGKTDSDELLEGDLRVVIAPFDNQPVAVLMQPKSSNAPPSEQRAYQSPVTTKKFDRVVLLQDADIHVTTHASGYTVKARLALTDLGLLLQPGMQLRGDVGLIASDEAGTVNRSRVYWANPHTNLVNDLPYEAWLTPAAWGVFHIK